MAPLPLRKGALSVSTGCTTVGAGTGSTAIYQATLTTLSVTLATWPYIGPKPEPPTLTTRTRPQRRPSTAMCL